MQNKIVLLFSFLLTAPAASFCQKVTSYDLPKMLRTKKLELTFPEQEVMTFSNPSNSAISEKGILWLKDVNFKEGTIDVDLRGRNVLLKSFVGIAFHARDTTAYELVYFCPFRFHDTDLVARKWSVKYMTVPNFDYKKLRTEQPGIYENEVTPAPGEADWFHATITVRDGWITVYMNHSATPSLRVKKLDTLTEGKIGLWSYTSSLSSDFANLSITR